MDLFFFLLGSKFGYLSIYLGFCWKPLFGRTQLCEIGLQIRYPIRGNQKGTYRICKKTKQICFIDQFWKKKEKYLSKVGTQFISTEQISFIILAHSKTKKVIYWLGRCSFICVFLCKKNVRGCALNFRLEYKITNLLGFLTW